MRAIERSWTMSNMVGCPSCGARWQSQATSGRSRCGRCRRVVAVPGKRRPAVAAPRRTVACRSCGHQWQSQATSGRTRCGQCRTLAYVSVIERDGEGDRALRPARPQPPARDWVAIRPRAEPAPDQATPTSSGAPLLAVFETFVERCAGASSDRAASSPPVAPVLAPVAASVPSGPTVAVRLRCGHTAAVSGPRVGGVGRELACATCGVWTGVEALTTPRCPLCTTGIAQCPLSGCPMPPIQ